MAVPKRFRQTIRKFLKKKKKKSIFKNYLLLKQTFLKDFFLEKESLNDDNKYVILN